MSTSVIEQDYVPPTRPYSQNELKDMRLRTFRSFRVGKELVIHRVCGHTYFATIGGRKEQEVKTTGNSDAGNCSVCWKIRHMPTSDLGDRAYYIASVYADELPYMQERLEYRTVELERIFYAWLYEREPGRDQRRESVRPRW